MTDTKETMQARVAARAEELRAHASDNEMRALKRNYNRFACAILYGPICDDDGNADWPASIARCASEPAQKIKLSVEAFFVLYFTDRERADEMDDLVRAAHKKF